MHFGVTWLTLNQPAVVAFFALRVLALVLPIFSRLISPLGQWSASVLERVTEEGRAGHEGLNKLAFLVMGVMATLAALFKQGHRSASPYRRRRRCCFLLRLSLLLLPTTVPCSMLSVFDCFTAASDPDLLLWNSFVELD